MTMSRWMCMCSVTMSIQSFFSTRDQLFWTTFHLKMIAVFSPNNIILRAKSIGDAAYLKRVVHCYCWDFFQTMGTLPSSFDIGTFLILAENSCTCRKWQIPVLLNPGKAEPLSLPGAHLPASQKFIIIKKKKDVISCHILGKSSLFHQMVMTLVMSCLYQRPTHSSKSCSKSKHPSPISQTLGQIHEPKL